MQDFFVVAVLVGIGKAFAIRKIQRPGRFRGSHLKEADYILFTIAGDHAHHPVQLARLRSRSATSPTTRVWTPVSNAARPTLRWHGSARRVEAIDTVFVWWHSLIILGFLVYITYSKHLHIITSGFNVLFTSERPKGALKPMHIDIEEMSEDDTFGAANRRGPDVEAAARHDDVH